MCDTNPEGPGYDYHDALLCSPVVGGGVHTAHPIGTEDGCKGKAPKAP